MTKHDSSAQITGPIAKFADILSAIGLLTRLPIRVDAEQATQRAALSAWAWPLAGLIPAIIAWVLAMIAVGLGLPIYFAAILAVLGQVVATGALHEDGLADVADGFWGGFDRARRLEIMKDSRIGAYGVIALILSLGLRITALATVLEGTYIVQALIVASVSSRLPMVLLMASLPNARGSGLANQVGRPSAATAWLSSGITAVVVLVLLPTALPALILFLGIGAIALAALAKAKIGGQTGDVLGASQQVSEIIALSVLAVVLGQ